MKVVTDNKHYNDIADAIREKTGTKNTYTPAEMASGVNEVYEAGYSQSELDFWNNFKRGKSYWNHLFTEWGHYYIRPPFKIVLPPNASTQFAFWTCWNLERVEKNYFDFSKITASDSEYSDGHVDTFAYCVNLKVIEDIGLPAGYYYRTFQGDALLHTIEVLRSRETTVYTSNAFERCQALKNITFEGVIGRNISFSSSPLSGESMKSVITHLKDYLGTTSEYTYTVTFKTSAFEALEAEGATAEYNGTPCTWAELIGFLKWNLVKA